jgi:L-alanine-DL-glutamate epimerase-like enolase superfamily enzyme
MRIRRLTASIVKLPLKRAFVHASAARDQSENVLVRCELADGTAGWGEGVPRSYVTGETPKGCLAQLAATPLGDQLSGDCQSWPDVVRVCEKFAPIVDRDDPRGCYGNALRCAVELSILDAFGRLFAEPVSTVTRYYPPAAPILGSHDSVRYSAVIDAGSAGLPRKALVRRLYGFADCKVKVGHPGDDDVERLRTIRRWIGRRMDLRVDANEAWPAAELRKRIEPLTAFNISCVEQPVLHAEVICLTEARKQIAVPIMLDESLTSIVDAEAAIAAKTCDLFNIRLSKCGGFLASLRIASAAHAAGLGYQLGCHPGETGVLSAAGRHLACSVDGVRYVEGSYDRYLFRRILTNEDITFGYGGRAPALKQPGLGVTIDLKALQDFVAEERTITVA